jgi:AcrR family transcriptional regulator
LATGLREKGKARRRGEVLSAASALWRDHGVASITLGQIAEAAELSTQTVYNLIGGVDEVKIAIVEELLQRLERSLAATDDRGVDLSIRGALASARLFVADPALYRQILVGIPQAVFDGARLSRDGSAIQQSALDEAQRTGELRDEVDTRALAWQIHLQYLGGLFSWACGSLDDNAFLRATEIGVLAALAACATEPRRSQLQERLRRSFAIAAGSQALSGVA